MKKFIVKKAPKKFIVKISVKATSAHIGIFDSTFDNTFN